MASRCQVPGSLTLQSDMGGHAKVNMHSRAAEILRSLPGHIADKILAGLRRSRISPAEAFAAIDTNGDGQLQEDEFVAGLRALQVDLSDGQFAVVLSKFDTVNSHRHRRLLLVAAFLPLQLMQHQRVRTH